MSTHSDLNIQEFHQLILNAGSYMTKIETFSFKIANSSIQYILKCLSIADQILKDQKAPMMKKLYVLRFVKDTMILASLPFYLCILTKIFPWIMIASKISETNAFEKRIQMIGKLLKGNQYDVSTDGNVCKSILQLVQQIIKWMGTNIRDHPYSKIIFQSAFRILLQRLPRIKNIRVTDLTFFKIDDPNKYQAYYMERQSGEAEGQRIFEYVSQMIQLAQRGKNIPDLQAFVQTGDQYVISAIIEETQGILQNANPRNVLNMLTLVDLIHKLMIIGDVEAVNLSKDYILLKVLKIILILHKHKSQIKNADEEIKTIISMIKCWNSKCLSLSLPVQVFRETFKLLQRQGIDIHKPQQLKIDYRPQIGLTIQINKEKFDKIDCNESETIQKIRAYKYIPQNFTNYKKQKDKYDQVNHSQSQNQQFLSSNKSNSKHSKVSENSFYNKKEFLQAFSKFPQQANIAKNTSEVNEIQLQHSNLSDHFHQINHLVQLSKKPINASQQSQKPLIMSFKKSDKQEQPYSPQVIFSDSFTSNQRNSPYKLVNSKDFVDVINQPSAQLDSKHLIKDSLKESGSQKNKSSQNSFNNPFGKGSNILNIEPQKAVISYNDYMIPQKNEISQPPQSYKSSKEGSRLKKQKSSSLVRSNNNRFLLKSTSRQKIGKSPMSKISNSKSINILQFNEAEYPVQQTYKPQTSAKNIPPPPVQQIKVQKTVVKPKFGFKIQQQSIVTESQMQPKQNELSYNCLNKSKSLSSIHSRRQQSHTLGTVPDNFMDLLNVKPQKVKVNGFDSKVKQLQKQIIKMKQKKQQAAKIVMQKNLEIMKLKAQMPLPKQQLEEENKKLRRAMQPKKSDAPEVIYKLNQAFETKAIMKHVSVTPLKQEIKKQILYSKCRLYKGQYVQIGFQAKNKEISIYFTFLDAVQQCCVKVEENSLILTEQIDVKIYKIIEGKQIKFKTGIKQHRIYNGQFLMANLIIRLQAARKKSQSIQISIPFHIYNIIQFVSPKSNIKFNRITDWHYCCNGILTNPHYLTDFFPKIKVEGAIFSICGQLDNNSAQIAIIINNDKFAIQSQGLNEAFELSVIRCVMALLQKSNN